MRTFDPKLIHPPRGSQVFQRPFHIAPETPVDLEIGCGVGWHPIDYAQRNPDRFLIAIERTSTKFAKFNRRYLNHPECSNLLPIHADVVPWVTHCLPENTISRFFILYPNSYPKNPSARFFKMPFFAELLRRGREDCSLELATNEKFYYEEALDLSVQQWGLEVASSKVLTRENFPKPRTHFEKKYLERGEICYDLTLRRVKK